MYLFLKINSTLLTECLLWGPLDYLKREGPKPLNFWLHVGCNRRREDLGPMSWDAETGKGSPGFNNQQLSYRIPTQGHNQDQSLRFPWGNLFAVL